MIPVWKLVPSVCTAVKELGESKGTSVQDITAYIRDIIHGKNVSVISVRKAIKAALENQLLMETKLGKFKLILNNAKAGVPRKMDHLMDDIDILMGKIAKRKKRTICKGRTSKRPKKPLFRRGCTPIWVPRKKQGSRRKARSCQPKRRRTTRPQRRRRTCPKINRKRSYPRRQNKKRSYPKRRRRWTSISRCEDLADSQDSQCKNVSNEKTKTSQEKQ